MKWFCWHDWQIHKQDSYIQIKANVERDITYEEKYNIANGDDTLRADCIVHPTGLISGSYIPSMKNPPPPPKPPAMRWVSEGGPSNLKVMKVCFKCGGMIDTYTKAELDARTEIFRERAIQRNTKQYFDELTGSK